MKECPKCGTPCEIHQAGYFVCDICKILFFPASKDNPLAQAFCKDLEKRFHEKSERLSELERKNSELLTAKEERIINIAKEFINKIALLKFLQVDSNAPSQSQIEQGELMYALDKMCIELGTLIPPNP